MILALPLLPNEQSHPRTGSWRITFMIRTSRGWLCSCCHSWTAGAVRFSVAAERSLIRRSAVLPQAPCRLCREGRGCPPLQGHEKAGTDRASTPALYNSEYESEAFSSVLSRSAVALRAAVQGTNISTTSPIANSTIKLATPRRSFRSTV